MRSTILTSIFFMLALLGAGTIALAQSNFITVTGQILDGETGKPLAFAHVGIAGRNLGTVSNPEGAFILKIPAVYRQDSLKVSLVGYQSYTSLIATLPEGPITIPLKPAVIELAEVQVKAKGLTGLDIFKAAVAAIPANYDSAAY